MKITSQSPSLRQSVTREEPERSSAPDCHDEVSCVVIRGTSAQCEEEKADLSGEQQHSPQQEQLRRQIKGSSSKKIDLNWTFLERGFLYGRDREVKQLQEAFERRISTRKKAPELCLVAGKSGTGKSILVKKALHELVEDHDGAYILGKFDQLKNPEPYGPFVVALTQLVIVLQQRYVQVEGGLKQLMLDQVGLESCYVLCSLVSGLSQVLGLDQKQTSFFALSAQQDRLKVALKKFFQVICSNETPVVLVMDDLQWSDVGSLQLLEHLVSEESSIEGLMVVGICRDNEVPWDHNFCAMLRRLEDEKGAKIDHIAITNLSLDVANTLASEVLSQPPQMCLSLTEIIHTATGGNAFFMLHYFKTLHQEGVLVSEQVDRSGGDEYTRSFGTNYQWLWDNDKWVARFHNLDMVDLVAFQIKRLPAECQQLLMTASCLGAEFDVSMLNLLLNGKSDVTLSDNINMLRALQTLVKEQMVVKQLHRSGKFAFAHDIIQQASFALVPQEERAMSHITIGRALFEGLSQKEIQENLFLVVNQMILGIPLLCTETDKHGLATLALEAGKKASRASDLERALTYYQIGVGLLQNRHWRDEYHLSLDLFNSLAEAQAFCGHFDSMDMTLEEAISNCRSENDKIRSKTTRIHSLTARLRFREALGQGFQIISSLGEKLPASPSILCLIVELVKVKRLLRGKTDADLLNLPTIENSKKKSAIEVLSILEISAFCGNPDYFPLMVLRMMKLTLKYGKSDEAPIVFAPYGMILAALGEYDEAYRFGQLSLRLMDQSENARRKWFPCASFIVHAAINPWKIPGREAVKEFPQIIAGCMEICDYDCAVYSAYSYCINDYLVGNRIPVIEERLEQHMEFIRRFQQGPWLALSLLARQFLLNLMDETRDPLLLDFRSEDCEEGRDYRAPTSGDKFSFQLQESTLVTHKLVLAYHFGDLPLALGCAKAVRAFEDTCKSTTLVIRQYFFDGMTALEAAHFGQRRKHLKTGRGILKKLGRLTALQADFLPYVSLLQGEIETLNKKNPKKAMEWFEKAMQQSSEGGARQIHALAYERAAIAQQRLGTEDKARVLMMKAIGLYDEWGAHAVSAHLKKKHNL